jgi:CheY-like chemotaxis protein
VTDLTLPDMDGGELIRRLRDAHPKLPILAISGASDDVLQSAWQNGADWVMRKPIVPVILLETAAYLIGGHVPQA